MSCNCTLNKYQLISNEGLNHYTLTELMRLVNGLILDPSFSYAVSNLDELNEIFKFYPTKEETIRILQGETGITPQRQNLNDYNLDYAWLNYYTKEEVITFIAKGYVPEKPPQTYTFTINPVPASATVVINGIESDTVVVYKGEQVLWTVSEDGYTTKMGVQDVEEDTTIVVSLEEYEEDEPSEDKPVYTVCVETEPSDAYVFINGERENCFSGAEGTVFDYTVQAGGYVPQSGKITIDGDKTVAVVLEKEPEPETPRYTLIINPVPASATVIIDGQVRNNITVESGTVVNYSVQAEGYFFQEGSYMVTENYVLDVELEALPNYVPNYYFSINPTPSDATVVINGNEQSTYEAQEGSIIVWSVSKEGYVSQNGTYVMGAEDYVMDVELVEYVVPTFTFTINPTPSDATVIIDGVEQSSITVEGGTIVSYSVDKEGYVARSESIVVDRDMVLNVSLRQIGIYTFTVNPYPNYAIVMIDDEIRNTIAVEEGTVVTWVVKLTGYASQAGTYKVEKDSSINVFIECMGEPQIIKTRSQLENAGVETGDVIDLCMYDFSQYDGSFTDGKYSFFEPFLISFEGDILSDRWDYKYVFSNLKELKEIKYLGRLGDGIESEFDFMCKNCTSLVDVSGFNTNIQDSVHRMFSGCTSLTHAPNTELWYNIEDFCAVFENCSSLTDISGLRNISFKDSPYVYSYKLFENCTSLTDLSPIADWDMTNFVYFTEAFKGCTSLSDLTPLSKWRFPNADEMGGLFAGCTSLTSLNGLEDWTFISKEDGQNFYYSDMFSGCENLVDVSAISNWNLVIESGSDMFRGCGKIRKLDLSKWDFSSYGGNIGGMFRDCYNLNEVKFGGEFASRTLYYYQGGAGYIYPFHNINTTGTLYYPAEFADSYTELIEHIPSTWTAVAY